MPHRPDSVIFAATQCGLPIQQWDGAQIFWHHQQREKPESYSKGKNEHEGIVDFLLKMKGDWNPAPNPATTFVSGPNSRLHS